MRISRELRDVLVEVNEKFDGVFKSIFDEVKFDAEISGYPFLYENIKKFSFVDIDRKENKILVLPNNVKVDGLSQYDIKKRMNPVKPGKIVSLFAKYHDMASLCDEVMKEIGRCSEHIARVKVTSDFGYVYNMSGGVDSCMQDKDHDFFEIYNDAGCEVAYLTSEDDCEVLLARMILWNNIHHEELGNVKGFSTIYYEGAHWDNVLREWAERNGYVDLNKAGGDFKSKCTVPLRYRQYDSVPYIDTFSCYNYSQGVLMDGSLYHVDTSFTDTGGADERDLFTHSLSCSVCFNDLEEHEVFTTEQDEIMCESCFNESTISPCVLCGTNVVERVNLENFRGSVVPVCRKCRTVRLVRCGNCNRLFEKGKGIKELKKNFCSVKCFEEGVKDHVDRLLYKRMDKLQDLASHHGEFFGSACQQEFMSSVRKEELEKFQGFIREVREAYERTTGTEESSD